MSRLRPLLSPIKRVLWQHYSVPSCSSLRYYSKNNRTRVMVKEELSAGGGYNLTPMGEGDAQQKTNVTPLKLQMRASSYIGVATMSQEGFRLMDNTFLWGPVAVFPKLALSWRVLGQDDITEESLEFFTLLQPKLDIVVVGVGERKFVDPVRKRIFSMFSKSRIGLEILPTYDAISTFNWLNAEGRYVAAALFPPKEVRLGYLEAMQTMFALDSPEILEEDIFGLGMKEPPTEIIRKFIKGEVSEEERKEIEMDNAEIEAMKQLEAKKGKK